MPATAELVGRVGRLAALHPPTEHGLTLTLRVLPAQGTGTQTVTACALTADTLALATQQGCVYAVHLTRQRYVCLDVLPAACTATAFMTRISRRLFVGCADGAVHCYDVSTSSRLAQLPGHRAAVMSLSTKPDTEQLLSASADTVLLWDMATFRQRRVLGSARYGSSQAAFTPAGNLCAAATTAGAITVWDAKSLRELAQLHTPAGQQQQHFAISSMSFSPDEKWLLVGCKAPALLLRYNLQSKELQCALQLPQEMFGIVQVKVLPDSTSAVVLTSDGCISFVDLEASCVAGQLQLTAPGCRALSFSTEPRANAMAVVCSDGLVRLFDLAAVRAKQQGQGQGQRKQLQQLHQQQLLQVSTSADVLPVLAGAQPGASRVLSNVSNIDHTGKAPAKANAASRRAGQSTPAQLHVRQLSGPAAALNRRKLQDMLRAFGEFPSRYRQLIWEHLLELPHNSEAFSLLQDQGCHPAFSGLLQQLQGPGGIRSSVAVRLQACLSQLARWCPLFGEVGFLPDLAFPFVKVFGPKAESAFEAVATLLLNWCKGWFELFPIPPLPLLRRFLLLLSQHDLELGSHLQQLGVPLLERVWRHMSGAMSDLLPDADDWLVLWDHILAAPAGPCFYYSVLCSYLISQRQHLLQAVTDEQLTQLFAARPPVDIRKVIKAAQQLHDATPGYAQLGLSSLSPLTPGSSYPVFADYPTGSVELQQLERTRIQEAEEALIRRRQVVAELEQRSKQVAYDAAALTSQRQQLVALDAQRRAALRAIEDSLASAGARLDDRAKEEKLRQIRLAEEAYQASLSSLRAEWSAELAALKTDVEHKRRLAAATLKARQEEEDLKVLEFQAQQRLWALQQEELAAAGTSALRDAASTQASALAAQVQHQAAEWQVQDEARALKRQHELARKARLAAAAEQEAALQAAKGVLLTQELQAQEELAKVQHQRQLRQLAEDEAELTAQQLQLQAEKQAVAAAAGRQAIQEQAQAQTARFTQLQQERASAVSATYAALQQQLSELHLAAAELGSSARLSEAQQQLAHMQATLAEADAEHEARVSSILSKLQVQETAKDPSLGRAGGGTAAAASFDPARPAASIDSSIAGSSSAAEGTAAAGSPAQPTQPETSVEAIEQRLAAIRQRRAALESLYGAQVDAEVQRLVAATTQQAAQQSPSASTRAYESAAEEGLSSPAEASAGSGSSGDSSKTDRPTASAGSVDVSAELEHLLAEAEAEVQRELAAARVHLGSSGRHGPYSSTRTPPLLQQYPSLQSSVGRGRGRSSNASVAQGSHTASTGGAASAAAPAAAAGATRAAVAAAAAVSTAAGRLKPVLEEPASADKPAAGAGHEGAPKPADSSSSSSSSPDKKAEGGDINPAKVGSSSQAAAAAAAARPRSSRGAAAADAGAAAAAAGPPTATQQVPTDSSSSHGSGVGHNGQAGAAAAAVVREPHPGSPSSTYYSVLSSAAGAAGTSDRQAPQPSQPAMQGSSGGVYEAVLVAAAGTSHASADAERLVAALSAGPDHASSTSGDTSSSSVSKPGSLSFAAPGASGPGGEAPSITPTLGPRTQPRTRSWQQADSQAVGAGPPAAAPHSVSSSSVRASLQSVGPSSSGQGDGQDDVLGPVGVSSSGQQLQARYLEPSGRVSSELTRSSSATSEELEHLLHQLSQYEEHLLEEAQAVSRGGGGGGQQGGQQAAQQPQQHQQQPGEVRASVDSSLSWSQTLAGLTHLLPPEN